MFYELPTYKPTERMKQQNNNFSHRNATEGFTVNLAVRFTKEGDGHMNRLTQKVQAGKLCDMETAPKFIGCGK